MTNESWKNLGITSESGFLELLFDPYSRSLVAQFYRDVGDNYHIKSLYIRSIKDQSYRRLADKSETLSYDEAIIFPSGPFLLVNILEALKDGDRYGGYDWYAIQVLKLPEGDVVSEVRDCELLGELDGQRTWISKLHGVSQDGGTIYCTVGIPERGAESSVRMRYHLAELDIKAKSFEVVTELNVCL